MDSWHLEIPRLNEVCNNFYSIWKKSVKVNTKDLGPRMFDDIVGEVEDGTEKESYDKERESDSYIVYWTYSSGFH